jgi:Skp family chaperone for outer membrane proteins
MKLMVSSKIIPNVSSKNIQSGIVKLGTIALLLFTLIASTTTSYAQGRSHRRVYTKADVNRIIERVETRGDVLRKAVDRFLDRSNLDGTKREDRINEEVKELEEALDNLRREFDKRQQYQETREEVAKVLDEAQEINRLFRNNRFTSDLQREWLQIRRDINRLALVYNLPLLRA